MMMKSVLIIFLAVAALGCISDSGPVPTNQTNVSFVQAGDRVFVDYTGRLENGTVFDSSIGAAPIEFVAGRGQMIEGFENAVMDMRVGQEKTITLQPSEAYGDWSETNIIEVNRTLIPNNTQVGDVLYSGSQQVVVLELKNQTAMLDFNHPLAGKVLVFDIKIIDIQKQVGS
jgi:peptidylprolyl isomerase